MSSWQVPLREVVVVPDAALDRDVGRIRLGVGEHQAVASGKEPDDGCFGETECLAPVDPQGPGNAVVRGGDGEFHLGDAGIKQGLDGRMIVMEAVAVELVHGHSPWTMRIVYISGPSVADAERTIAARRRRRDERFTM